MCLGRSGSRRLGIFERKRVADFGRRFLAGEELHDLGFVDEGAVDLGGNLIENLERALPARAVVEQAVGPREIEKPAAKLV